MLKSADLNKNGFFLLLVALLLLNLGALAFSPFNENQQLVQVPAREAAAIAGQKIELKGAGEKEILLAGSPKKFVSCSTGWEETETPNFYFCASKKKYEFCQSLELEGKKCDNFNGVKNGGSWVEFDLGNNEKRQVIFSANTIFEDDSSGEKQFVPFYEKHKLSVKDGDFKMQWGKNNNDAEIRLTFGIDGQIYTIAGLKTLDAGVDVKTFAKNLGGGTKIWYEVKNIPQEIRDKLEFIKMGIAPQAGFQKEQIKKNESDTKKDVILPEQLDFDLSDLKESGFDVSFENDYTVVIKAGEKGWDQDIVLDPIFQSSSVAEDVTLYAGIDVFVDQVIFMKFNISSIPTGRTINSATLQMTVDVSSDDNDCTFYHLDQNQTWTENNTAAQIQTMHKGTFQSISSGCFAGTGDKNATITTVFQAAYSAGDTNFSFRLEDPDNNSTTPTARDNSANLFMGDDGITYKSFESSEGTKSPILFVDYANAIANSAPDVNVTKIDGWVDSATLPVFGYTRDGNLTIDVNVQDPNNDRLTIDLNYATANTQGSGTAFYRDLNLTTSAPANCDDLNFQDSTECSIDLNIFNFGDTNWYVLANVKDASLNDFNASDNSFKIDNNAPTSTSISVTSYTGATGYTNSTTPPLTLSATDANAMAFSCDNTTYSSYVAYAASYSDFNAKSGGGCTNADGNKTIYVRFRDTTGNVAAAANTGSFVVDETTPTATSVTVSSTGQTGYTSQQKPTFTITASDSTAGLSGLSLSCSNPLIQINPPTEDIVLYTGPSAGFYLRSFLRFDTSSIPSGATINSAKLQLYTNLISGAPDDDISFYHLDQNQGWTESNTAAQLWAMHTGTFLPITTCYTATGDQNCTITSVFQASYSQADTNFSIRFEDPDRNSTAPDTKSNTGNLLIGDSTTAQLAAQDIPLIGQKNSHAIYFIGTPFKRFDSSEGSTNPPILFVDLAYGGYSAYASSYSDFNITSGQGCTTTDGNNTIYLLTRDRAYNSAPAITPSSFVFDGTSPTLSSPLPASNANTTDTTPDLEVTFTETNNWYCRARPFKNGVAQADSNVTMSGGKCLYTAPTLNLNDTILVQFKMTDMAGNTSSDLNTGIYTISLTENTPGGGGTVCGDSVCNGGETAANCPNDCARCGDGTCNGAETSSTCPNDCPSTTCGNGKCEASETYAACPADCPQPSRTCQELVGTICSQFEACSGNLLNATDLGKCCSAACVAEQPELSVELYSDPIVPENQTGKVVATIYNKGGAAGPFEVVLTGPLVSAATPPIISPIPIVKPPITQKTLVAQTMGEPKKVFEEITASLQETTSKVPFVLKQTVGGLAAGNAASIKFEIPFDKSWAYSVQEFIVAVDSKNSVAEKDEANNTAKASIYFGGKEVCGNNKDDNGNGEIDENCGIPDLYIKDVTSGRANPVQSGKRGAFTFDVTVGVKYACVKNVKFAMFEADSATPLSTTIIGELCPGKEKTLDAEYDSRTPAAAIIELQTKPTELPRILPKVNFVIDPDNEIVETNKANNFSLATVKLPELRILDLKSPASVFYQDPFEITAVVDNNGFAPTADFDVVLSFENSGQKPQIVRVGPILSGTKKEVKFSFNSIYMASQAELPKQFRFKIEVDPKNEVSEENERNNETSSAFDIIKNEVYFYDKLVNNENLLVGLWAEKNEALANYSFSVASFNPDGTVLKTTNAAVIQTIVLSDLSSARDFVIFEMNQTGEPTGIQPDGSIVPPNALSVKLNGAEIKNGKFYVTALSDIKPTDLANIYNLASDTSLLLKISPQHLKRMHYERIKNLNIMWWRIWYLT